MAKKNPKICASVGCQRPRAIEVYCTVHGPPMVERREAREDGLAILHYRTVDQRPLTDALVRQERERLGPWWTRACDAVNYDRVDPVLQDEAKYAVEWCISRAGDLARRERAARLGDAEHSLMMTEWVWERFAALEAGLVSNGRPRSNRSDKLEGLLPTRRSQP